MIWYEQGQWEEKQETQLREKEKEISEVRDTETIPACVMMPSWPILSHVSEGFTNISLNFFPSSSHKRGN